MAIGEVIGFGLDEHEHLKIGIDIQYTDTGSNGANLDCALKKWQFTSKHSTAQQNQVFTCLRLRFIEGWGAIVVTFNVEFQRRLKAVGWVGCQNFQCADV